jgi:dipeptidyl-peptidase-4
MKHIRNSLFVLALSSLYLTAFSQVPPDSSLLTIDRVFGSPEFRQESVSGLQWISGGTAYIVGEPSASHSLYDDLIRVETATQQRTVFLSADQLIPPGTREPLRIEAFYLSPDESRVLIFTNSSRVWRSNTKGDFWLYDLTTRTLRKLGTQFPASSLMFAKLSQDNQYVAYVYDFNLYRETVSDGTITQLTFDGTGDIINGTFDWVYEEEFGCRDGFRWNSSGAYLAFWQLDASTIGTFYMINNTDSVYSRIIPIQYPKVGQPPSSCKVGIIQTTTGKIHWIPVPGDPVENYIPRMQWINDNILLIQQINRRQNNLRFYTYSVMTGEVKMIYEESHETWVDISYPDVTADSWEMEDLIITDDGQAVLKMSESYAWRRLIKINLTSGRITVLTPGDYDVARYYAATDRFVYFSASPRNSTQRYLYRVSLAGKGDTVRITPRGITGMNRYNVSPDGQFAVYRHSSASQPPEASLISLPAHKTIAVLADNAAYKKKISKLQWPTTDFFTVTTADGVQMDVRMTKPVHFNAQKRYPVLFNVYGEPAGQEATDSWLDLWTIMLAQQGYLVIAMDNRGTPCLKGTTWRKSIYQKTGVINARDQAMATRELLKLSYIDSTRIAVWGWSGGGTMTLNLLFRYPEIYQTGMAVAAVSDQLTYDKIYTERYMGLPAENPAAFTESSAKNFAGALRGNLLIVHGTGDDNVHYQNAEMVVNELIKHNKQFAMMAYPNRSHGIYEGKNTRKHLYTLLTNYLNEHCPAGGR